MDFDEIVRTRRSIRRFKQKKIERQIILSLLESARCAPSAGNKHPIEYVIVDEQKLTERLFEQLFWAVYIRPKRNPVQGRRPVAYIVVMVDSQREIDDFGKVDAAAAIENIILNAWSKGIGSCWLGSVRRENIRALFAIPENLKIDSVIALGYPDEKPVMEDAKNDNDEGLKYYLDDNDILHVPKRPLASIGHLNRYGTAVI
jgi:nitroreductase